MNNTETASSRSSFANITLYWANVIQNVGKPFSGRNNMNARKPASSHKVKFIRNSNRTVWEKITDGISAIINASKIEKSIQNQLWGALAMLATLILLQPAIFWWGLCLFGSTMCLTMEFFNTSIEQLADYINPEYDPRIGRIKDLAAGGTVMASIGTFISGVLMILDTFSILG